MPVDEFGQSPVELLLAAEDHVLFLEVGGKAQPVELRPRGQCAADVPGVGGAADGPVHQVQGVGDGIEHHPGAAEDAGPLADGAGQAVPVAVHLEGRFALAVDLVFAFFKNRVVHDFSLGQPIGSPLRMGLGAGVWGRPPAKKPLAPFPNSSQSTKYSLAGPPFSSPSRMASMASSPSTPWYQ